jgi:succinyl-diaminopimelate desuccinylase
MMMNVELFCADLIKCKSITPNDDGAIDYISNFLSSIGFETQILIFKSEDGSNSVKNLFARYESSSSCNSSSSEISSDETEKMILGFVGHSDVVPPGDDWEVDPFSAVQKDGFLIGRGVADMKGGIAAFCCAVAEFIASDNFDGVIEFFITGDEEIGSKEGIQSLIKWAMENDYVPNDCLIGEPSSNNCLGDRIYLGHRGSLNVVVESHGRQGHVAYPNNFCNSLMNLCKYIVKISDYQWEHKDKRFPETNLEATMLFTNNYATNVVPELSSVNLNIRFGADYTEEKLQNVLKREAENFDGLFFKFFPSGEAYYCDNDNLKNKLSSAIREITGIDPSFSAAGGTSDGRFLAHLCNVIEFGVPDATIHQKNEKVKIEDLQKLKEIYFLFLKKYFH